MTQETIGILALQGNVAEHGYVLDQLGVRHRKVRLPRDVEGLSGLILPGGESTTMSKLMVFNELEDPLREALRDGLPAYGTCAGMILLADEVLDTRPDAVSLGAIDITVRRNAFGRQVDSFETDLDIPQLAIGGDQPPVHAAFIRAPWVERVGDDVEVLARVPESAGETAGTVVGVRQGSAMATSFHPESTGETRLHEFFLRELVGI
ncbi:pyridoxal 5'-phosphate synthase glutaminase subunit PdxT [Corynebacterium sp. 239_CJEI]|uniref:pyridoxal 5'-phosphate synthase glutaminase subunit PdxT n=1 Tax=Corynebacterium sp. 239_CJEI TaxID=2715674 RepID=UPI00066800B1|nr:pyridoxal 5'-phosphate synthase glutaminase subunit PdxT [Corynebacterium sp. 239_CJEI]